MTDKADDLRARCAEILEWRQTGILRGSALRDYAGKLREKFGNVFDAGEALAIAEKETARELMEAALAHAEQPVAWPWRTKYQLHQRVRKTKGSSWQGRIVGFYASSLTTTGYAVESEREPGSVQIYPEAALELVPDALSPSKIEAGENTAETAAPVPQKASLHPAGIAAAIDAVYATADGDARQVAEAVVAAYALATTEGSDNGN